MELMVRNKNFALRTISSRRGVDFSAARKTANPNISGLELLLLRSRTGGADRGTLLFFASGGTVLRGGTGVPPVNHAQDARATPR